MSLADQSSDNARIDPAFDVVGCFLGRARQFADRPWLHQPIDGRTRTISWGEAAHEVCCIASALRAMAFPAGSRICISGRNTAHWILADIAIMLAGYVPVGLFPGQSLDNTRFILAHTDAAAIFIGPSEDLATTLAAVPSSIHTISLPYPTVPQMEQSWDQLVTQHSPLLIENRPPPLVGEVAMLLYTSGTSGRPKGVMLTHGNIAYTARMALAHVFKPNGKQRLVSYLPLAHAQERLTCEALSLLVGAEIHFLEKLESLSRTLVEVAPTFFTGGPQVYERMRGAILDRVPPARLQRWLRVPLVGRGVAYALRRRLGLHRAALCVVGGAKAADDLINWFAELGVGVRQGYGSTENCGYVACNLAGSERVGTVGRALPGAELRIAVDGELQCRHSGTMYGYFGDPDGTAQALTADGYFRTGDIGILDADGFLSIRGRLGDKLITPDGASLFPGDVESAVTSHMIAQMCLLSSERLKPTLVITLKPQAQSQSRLEVESNLTDVIAHANAKLEVSARVDRILIAKALWMPAEGLVTPTMKIRRREIARVYGPLAQQAASRDRKIVWEDECAELDNCAIAGCGVSHPVPAHECNDSEE
ncbi:long-chain fatty acid--CoA ligase [Xanthomonas cerealis pv. cerealis]|uniref:Long-chain fatty acid--CoA ligase n=1 Tax=Xanthomonas cerealis pv. cerealis TaxID=152263 RepID=A0A514EBP9_9XANT|nr:AMP-binding protein [Xanthomonas translucens]QDI03457.1 long-chain fatty acid--CoA ligase [Xanthomonas translucens pv. cerealis]